MIEIQETVVRNCHAYFSFERKPRFVDLRGSVIEAAMAALDLEDWILGDERVTVGRDSPNVLVGADEDSCVVGRDDPENPELAGPLLLAGANSVIDVLGVQEISYIGAGVTAIAAVNAFDELTEWLTARLGPVPRFHGVFGSKPTNAWWKLSWEHEHRGYAVEIGPATSESPVVETSFINSAELELPPVMLMIDLRRSIDLEEPVSPTEFVDLQATAITDSWAALRRLDNELRRSDVTS
jgi:hypothetical protein